MLHIYKYILSDYIDSDDKKKLLCSDNIEDFNLPFNLLNINVRAFDDYTLRVASENGRLDVVKYLINKGADIHSDSDYPFVSACNYGYLDTAIYLDTFYTIGEDISVYQIAFELASGDGHLHIVKFLLNKFYSGDKKINIHGNRDYALRYASENGHLDMVTYLSEIGANIHAYHEYAIIWASFNGHFDIVKFLVDKGADIHVHNNMALRYARGKNHHDIINFLTSLG